MTISQLSELLIQSNADFEIIKHDKPILKAEDASRYFDISKAAPVFVIATDKGLYSLVVSAQREKIDFKSLGRRLGFNQFKLADKQAVFETTKYEVGEIPLVGLNIPCLFDKMLLDFDYIFGGTGDKYHTLKINPHNIVSLNTDVVIIDI